MGDYLWDKTGEPDAEAERLEELLGQLRFQPTPFDLPAGLPAKESRAVRTPRSVLSWPRLALAASVALAALAGAWLVLKQQTAATSDQPQVAVERNQPGAGGKNSTAALTKANENGAGGAAAENRAGGEKKVNETPAAPSQGNEKRREERVAFPQRPRVPAIVAAAPRRAPRVNRTELVRATKRQNNPAEWRTKPTDPAHMPPHRRGELARAAAEREAAEKVLYALRVTSEKLNYARRQVQEAGRDDNR